MATARQQGSSDGSRSLNLPPIRSLGQTTAQAGTSNVSSSTEHRTRRAAQAAGGDQAGAGLPKLSADPKVQQLYETSSFSDGAEVYAYDAAAMNPRARALAGPSAAQRNPAGAAGTHLPSITSGGMNLASRQSRRGSATRENAGMPPSEVLRTQLHKLSTFEQTEICDFEQIYFIGGQARRPNAHGPANDGYDTEDGTYIAVLHDHIAYRYEIIRVLGKGSFGQVLKVS